MPSNQNTVKSLKSKYAAGEKHSRHAAEEFGPGKHEFVFCPRGEAVYYKKSWHHASDFFTATKLSFVDKKGVKFKLCPIHEMIKNKQYEGEIVIKNIPVKFKSELVRLIENMGETATRIDVLDRILDLRFKNKDLRITTSENQLAWKIARKVTEVFKKKAQAKISRAKEGDLVRINVLFI